MEIGYSGEKMFQNRVVAFDRMQAALYDDVLFFDALVDDSIVGQADDQYFRMYKCDRCDARRV